MPSIVKRCSPGSTTPELAAVLAELRSIARTHLAEAERAVDGLAAAIKPAFLPLALVGPYLDRMERADYDPLAGACSRWRRGGASG